MCVSAVAELGNIKQAISDMEMCIEVTDESMVESYARQELLRLNDMLAVEENSTHSDSPIICWGSNYSGQYRRPIFTSRKKNLKHMPPF